MTAWAASSRPRCGHDALHALVALEARDLVAADDLDAVLLEHAPEVAPGGGAEAALERMVLEHDHRHLLAQLGQRGGDLGGDVGAAHADDVLGALGLRADAVGVAERAQVVHALELGAVDRQAADHGAGRDQRAVEADLLLGRELGRARGGVEVEDARARQQLDVVGLPPVGVVHVGALGAVLAAQVLLGGRRAVVGRMRLAPDEQDRAVEALLAQRVRGGRRGDASADEEDVDRPVRHATDRTLHVGARPAPSSALVPSSNA